MSSNIRLQKICLECRRKFIARTTVTKFCNKTCNNRYYKREQRLQYLDTVLIKEREICATALMAEPSRRGRPRKPIIQKNFTPSPTNSLTRKLLDIQELALVIGLSERTIHRLLKDIAFPNLVRKRALFERSTVINYLTIK